MKVNLSHSPYSVSKVDFLSLTTDNRTQATDHPTTIEMASYIRNSFINQGEFVAMKTVSVV